MKTTLKQLAAGAVTALSIGLMAAPALAADTIRIGSFLSVTGPASFLGDPELKTLELYIDKLNEDGGLLGKQVELVHYDDVGDAANHGSSRELTTHLAALENRELCQIEQALQLIRDGRYGKYERCNHSIPIERLRAVPTTIMCVACQSELELTGGLSDDGEADWGNAMELEGRMNPTEVTLRDIDVD